MATRMTTLLYGEAPEADVAPGNRADAADEPGASGAHPRLLPTVELRAVAATGDPTLPPPPPTQPVPSPWTMPPVALPSAPPVALPSLVLGLVTVAAIFGGLAIWAGAFAWAGSMTRVGQLGLTALGGYLIAAGIAVLLSPPSPTSFAQTC
jgi:hypothetical protein